MEILNEIMPILLNSTAPGACGGISTFLFSLKKGHYKNNKYIMKFLVEILGAVFIASFIGPLFPEKTVIYISFGIGLSWATVIQIIRNKITKIVKAAIGEDVS